MIKKFLTIILPILFVVSMLPLSTVAAEPWTPGGLPHPYLTPKWAGYVAGGGLAVVTADVFEEYGGEEVFHAGGPFQPSSMPGRVTCLNGRNGYEIWKSTIVGIGITAMLQMADIDHDEKLEIVVTLQHPAGVYILNAEDGSILWRPDGTYNGSPGYITPIGGRIDGNGVIGDTDGDENLDIFIGVMAYEGYPDTGKIVHTLHIASST